MKTAVPLETACGDTESRVVHVRSPASLIGRCIGAISAAAGLLTADGALALEGAPALRRSLGPGDIELPGAPPAPWAQASVTAVLLAATMLFAIIALLTLIRTRRAVAAADARFYQLAEQGSDVVLRIRGRKQDVSRSVFDLLGYSSEEMATLDWAALVHLDDVEEVLSTWMAMSDRTARDLGFRMIHRDGRTIFVEAKFHRVDKRGTSDSIVTLRDVTARREENDGLRRAMEAARAAEAAAAEASRAKGEFLATMSHEIRTPLNAIIGFADLIIADRTLAPTARRHAERVKAGGDALLTVVNDILDYSQVEAGALRLDPRPFALPLLVDECFALVETAARARNLALRVSIDARVPPGVIGDETRLRQILLNLLNNAIKFTPAGSVVVRIRRDARDHLLFEVEDTGIGIAAGELGRLFERFRQVDGTVRRKHGGTGLGLAICKMLVEAMGGSIGVRSAAGTGSTFWFSLDLPSARLRLETAREPIVPTAPARPLRILLVEDVRLNQELVLAVLQAAGHAVDVVADGAEAIMAAEQACYDLVLMDVQMPYIDGMTATRAIRCLPQASRVMPIIGLSANVLPAQVEAAMAAGMDDFLTKPLTLDALGAVLRRAEAGQIRSVPDAASHDAESLRTLAAILGDAKTRDMLATLETSLLTRFASPLNEATAPALKAEAHAVLAGGAMLGFKRFAALCRTFIETEGENLIAVRHDELVRELGCVIRHSGALAREGVASGRRAA